MGSAGYYSVIPELSLPWFTGNQQDWIEFIEEFETMIDSQDLPDERKFLYLKRCLSNDVKHVIGGYPLIDYLKALDALRQRFGDRLDNLDSHMNAILDLKSPTTDDPQGLLQFYDDLQYHVRILKRLDFTGDDLLLPIMKKKLPGELRAQIYRTCKNLYNFSTFCQALYQVILLHCDSGPTTSSQSSNYCADKGPCAYCKKRGHSPLHCTAVHNPLQRLQIAKTDRLCFNCLGPHQQRHCHSKFSCKLCGQSHHTTLHDVVCDGHARYRARYSARTRTVTSTSVSMQSQHPQEEIISPRRSAQHSDDPVANEHLVTILSPSVTSISTDTITDIVLKAAPHEHLEFVHDGVVVEKHDMTSSCVEKEVSETVITGQSEEVIVESNLDMSSVNSVDDHDLANPLDWTEKANIELVNPSLENVETSISSLKPVMDAAISSTSIVDELHDREQLLELNSEVSSYNKLKLVNLNSSDTTSCSSKKIHYLQNLSFSRTSGIRAVVLLCLAFIILLLKFKIADFGLFSIPVVCTPFMIIFIRSVSKLLVVPNDFELTIEPSPAVAQCPVKIPNIIRGQSL